MTTQFATSADGTRIAYETSGAGPTHMIKAKVVAPVVADFLAG